MARHIWDLDDPRYRFGLARFRRRRAATARDADDPKASDPKSPCTESGRRPEGIVEANRRARRENRVLRNPK